MHDYDRWNGNDGYDDLGPLSMLLGLVVLFLFILAGRLWREVGMGSETVQHDHTRRKRTGSAKKRYATGEISKEEFERIRRSNKF